jgi:hypothetical protein
LKHFGYDPLRPELLTYPALRAAAHISSREVPSISERKHASWFNGRKPLLMEAIAVYYKAQLEFNRKCANQASLSLNLKETSKTNCCCCEEILNDRPS